MFMINKKREIEMANIIYIQNEDGSWERQGDRDNNKSNESLNFFKAITNPNPVYRFKKLGYFGIVGVKMDEVIGLPHHPIGTILDQEIDFNIDGEDDPEMIKKMYFIIDENYVLRDYKPTEQELENLKNKK